MAIPVTFEHVSNFPSLFASSEGRHFESYPEKVAT
jgi:hypothetical protein